MQYPSPEEMVAFHKIKCQMSKFRELTKPELEKLENQKRMQLQCQMNAVFLGDTDEFIERMTDDLCWLVYLRSKT